MEEEIPRVHIAPPTLEGPLLWTPRSEGQGWRAVTKSSPQVAPGPQCVLRSVGSDKGTGLPFPPEQISSPVHPSPPPSGNVSPLLLQAKSLHPACSWCPMASGSCRVGSQALYTWVGHHGPSIPLTSPVPREPPVPPSRKWDLEATVCVCLGGGWVARHWDPFSQWRGVYRHRPFKLKKNTLGVHHFWWAGGLKQRPWVPGPGPALSLVGERLQNALQAHWGPA